MNSFDTDEPRVVIDLRQYGRCNHDSLIVDMTLENVECKTCGEKLNAFSAVRIMMRMSEKWKRQKAEADLAIEAAAKKTRTKCQHCKQMTKVRIDVKAFAVVAKMQERK